MKRFYRLIITFFFMAGFLGCSGVEKKSWTKLVPENSSFLIVPDGTTRLSDILEEEYSTYLEDLTPSALQQITNLDSVLTGSFRIKAMILYPATSVESHLVWINDNPDKDLNNWASQFYEPFSQNNYLYQDILIHRLFMNNREIYASQLANWLVISESSFAIERSIRAYLGIDNPIDLSSEPDPGSFIVNTPHMDEWIEQFALVEYRPSVHDAFIGTSPISFSIKFGMDNNDELNLNGTMLLDEGRRSVLTDAMTFENLPVELDRYIAGNAASFALFRLPPSRVPYSGEMRHSKVDSLFLGNPDLYQSFSDVLEPEFALVNFSESGLSASGEYLWMRKINQSEALQDLLNELVSESLIYTSDNSYQINSGILARLIASEMTDIRDFYLSITGEVAVLAKRKGLAESVAADRNRRRVIYYDQNYSTARSSFPENISGMIWLDAKPTQSFLNPYLKPDNLAGGIFSKLDLLSFTVTTQNSVANISVKSHKKKGADQPYEELWVLPLNEEELTGKPVYANLLGSVTEEIIISTSAGQVLALAADGTIAMQTTTNGEIPIGSPVIYDWYGNRQPAILQAAGSKIFAWNQNGSLLPQFPIEMGEQISAPILVSDISRNGVPEIVVATEDRRLHVVDGRGQNINGWPQILNAPVNRTPLFDRTGGIWTLWAFAQNTLHGWLNNGTPRPGFPQFINAPFTGSPMVIDGNIIGSSSNGQLYAIGENTFFSDSLATTLNEDSLKIQSLYVANDEINNLRLQQNVLFGDSTGFYREDVFSIQSINGPLFLYNMNGELEFTQSLGQPSSETYAPEIIDINGDGNRELIALAEFGRLFAWEILTGERIYGIPTSGMRYPVIEDINGDGRMELIAQTREGLRCWTINITEE